MRDLADLLDPALRLPIRGKEYRVECSAYQGLRLHRLIATGVNLTDDQERDEIITTLGDAYQQMLDDRIPWALISHAGRTAIFWFGHSPELGQKIWAMGDTPGNPIPPSPRQKAMGDTLRKLFRKSASATTSAAAH